MNTYCQNIETEITDYVTGELTKETKQKIWTCKKNDEPFFMTYTRFMAVLYDLDSAATIKVLWKFLEYSEFNTGNVFIPAWRKEENT